MARNCRE